MVIVVVVAVLLVLISLDLLLFVVFVVEVVVVVLVVCFVVVVGLEEGVVFSECSVRSLKFSFSKAFFVEDGSEVALGRILIETYL